jgi:hypothetical protein
MYRFSFSVLHFPRCYEYFSAMDTSASEAHFTHCCLLRCVGDDCSRALAILPHYYTSERDWNRPYAAIRNC